MSIYRYHENNSKSLRNLWIQEKPSRIHADWASGGHRHHRHSCRYATSRIEQGKNQSPRHPLYEQQQADDENDVEDEEDEKDDNEDDIEDNDEDRNEDKMSLVKVVLRFNWW